VFDDLNAVNIKQFYNGKRKTNLLTDNESQDICDYLQQHHHDFALVLSTTQQIMACVGSVLTDAKTQIIRNVLEIIHAHHHDLQSIKKAGFAIANISWMLNSSRSGLVENIIALNQFTHPVVSAHGQPLRDEQGVPYTCLKYLLSHGCDSTAQISSALNKNKKGLLSDRIHNLTNALVARGQPASTIQEERSVSINPMPIAAIPEPFDGRLGQRAHPILISTAFLQCTKKNKAPNN